jgi:predicted dehydrogenase
MSFKIGMIGCGRLASEFHGPAILRYAAAHPGAELIACCDIRPDVARQFASRYGFAHWETDFRRMLSLHEPDAVCLFVPEHLTCEIACQILERGFPLLLEKPPGMTVDQIDRMISTADSAGVHVDVAFNRRHMPLIRELMALIKTHIHPTDIQHIQYEMVRCNRFDPDFTLTAIHGIDLVQFVAGSSYRMGTCTYQPLPAFGPTVANFHLAARFLSGATAHLSFCPIAGAVVERLSVHACGHSFYVELPLWESLDTPGGLTHVHDGKIAFQISGADVGESNLPGGDQKAEAYGFYSEDEAFFQHVRNGQPAGMSLHGARQAVAIAQALRERAPGFTFAHAVDSTLDPLGTLDTLRVKKSIVRESV